MENAKIAAVLLVGSGILTWAQTPPFAHTQAAGPVGATTATLNGMVVPNGAETIAWFEWGTNSNFGQTTAPMNAGAGTAVIRVVAGVSNLALRSAFWCRLVASNSVGVLPGAPHIFTTGRKVFDYDNSDVPLGLNDVVAVAARDDHCLGLKSDGTVAGWGRNNFGQSTVPVGLSNVVAVAAGSTHSLALKSDGTVVAWGDNSYGQATVPTGLSNVIAVAGGYQHSLALRSDGTVVAWSPSYSFFGEANVPTGLSNVVGIAGGIWDSMALRSDGTVIAWGFNQYGQTNVPLGLSNVVSVAAGDSHNMALRADGTVRVWGWSGFGQTNVPPSLSNVVAMSAGGWDCMALKANGSMLAWPGNWPGPDGITNLVAIADGGTHLLFLGNLAPQSQDQSLTGAALNDLLVTLAGSDPDGDLLIYRISSLPTVGNLYQWTPSGRGAPITLPDTAVSDGGGRVIYTLPVSGSDNFTFVANDSLADSAPATVNVSILQPPVITSIPGMNTNGSFLVSFSAATNVNWTVWSSTNLTTWSALGPALQSTPGTFQYNDTNVANFPLRFYRVTSP